MLLNARGHHAVMVYTKQQTDKITEEQVLLIFGCAYIGTFAST